MLVHVLIEVLTEISPNAAYHEDINKIINIIDDSSIYGSMYKL